MGIKRGHFLVTKQVLARTALVAGTSLMAAPIFASDVRSEILGYLDEADAMQQRVDDADIDRADVPAVEKHYQDVRNTYISSPLHDGLDELKRRVDSFQGVFEKKVADFVTQMQSATPVSPEVKKQVLINNFNQCFHNTEDFNDFSSLPGDIQRFNEQAAATLSTRFKRKDTGNNGWAARSESLRGQFARISGNLDLTSKSWLDAAQNCCRTHLAANFTDGNSLCTNMRKTLEKDELISRNDANSLYFSIPASVDPPDPIKNGITGHMLADFARDRDYAHDLSGARTLAKTDLEAGAAEEERAYTNAEYECTKNLKKAQKDASPINKQVLTTIGKLLKCTVIPTIGVTTLDLQYQRMTTAIGAAPIQGDDWDVNCDPNEMAAYNAMRPSDVNVIAQQWGLAGLQNPIYIDTLRRLEPVRSPFPIIAMPGGQLLTPFGDISSADTSTNGSASRSGALASGASTSSGSGRSNRALVAASSTRGLSTSRVSSSALASRATPRRSLVSTQVMTQGIRTLTTQISNNHQVSESINALSSGISNTRSLSATMANNTRALGTAVVQRSVRTTSATQARTIVRGLTTTRASSVTATGIAASLGTRSTTAAAAGKSLNDVQTANDADRAKINKITQTALSMIQSYKDKSQTVITKIQELIAKRDQIVGGVLPKLVTKAPGKQASIMNDLRNQLISIDGQLGTLKTEYDVYDSGVRDQSSLVQRLQGFSPAALTYGVNSTAAGAVNNANGPAAAGLNPFANQVLPGVQPVNTAFPSAPSPTGMNSSTGVSRVGEWMAKMLFPMPVAVAASQKLGRYNSEQEWRAAYDYFVKDFDRYIKLRRNEEHNFAVQAKDAIEKQARLVTTKSATDLSTETINLMRTYSSTVLTESDGIINGAQAGTLRISPQQLSSIRKLRSNAQDSQDSTDQILLMYRDSYPHSVDENAETWWGMVPDMLIN